MLLPQGKRHDPTHKKQTIKYCFILVKMARSLENFSFVSSSFAPLFPSSIPFLPLYPSLPSPVKQWLYYIFILQVVQFRTQIFHLWKCMKITCIHRNCVRTTKHTVNHRPRFRVNCYRPSPAQSFLVPSPSGHMTIFTASPTGRDRLLLRLHTHTHTHVHIYIYILVFGVLGSTRDDNRFRTKQYEAFSKFILPLILSWTSFICVSVFPTHILKHSQMSRVEERNPRRHETNPQSHDWRGV
jgi:hypothetical protein